jgi:cytochrome b subunit of formate dehydrogenase
MAGVIAGMVCCPATPSAWSAENPSADAPDLNNNATCLGCHGNPDFSMPRVDGTVRSLYVDKSHFDASVHGKLLQCVSCHTKITEIPHKDVSKTLIAWRQSVPPMCGTCHTDELSQYLTSVHGKEVVQDGNPKAAVCSDCHSAHGIENPATNQTKLAILQNCGTCHEANLRSYLQTYHGQVATLGYAYTAKCFDCHGSHGIVRVSDPTSTVYPSNRLATCRKCHKDATAGFVTFEPHATTNDFRRYPYTWLASKFMIALLGGTFAFFWTHSALWLYREMRDRAQEKHRPHIKTAELLQDKPVYYQRWSAMWRLAHLAFAIIIIVLIFTGMTLFYADSFWAPAVQRAFGGPRITGTVHRIFAVAFVAIFFAHLSYVAARIGKHWRTFNWFGPYSLIPNLQDLWDIVGMFKWFIGLGPKPVFDKWTYWEKFDYWAPFWGVTIIGVSGAMLWFNALTATFLPGWVFNVATIFHGEEAFLAAGFLFTVHFFNNHWRPENFPLDTLMFTGAMPLEKFRREHSIEYNRLVEAGQLANYIVQAPSRPMTIGSKILGFTLMAAGLILLALIMIGFAHNQL